jgi:hypothetical protein
VPGEMGELQVRGPMRCTSIRGNRLAPSISKSGCARRSERSSAYSVKVEAGDLAGTFHEPREGELRERLALRHEAELAFPDLPQ